MIGIEQRMSQHTDLGDHKLLTFSDKDMRVEQFIGETDDAPNPMGEGRAFYKYGISTGDVGKHWVLNGVATGDLIRYDDDWKQFVIFIRVSEVTLMAGDSASVIPEDGQIFVYDDAVSISGDWSLIPDLDDGDYVWYNPSTEEWEIYYDVSEMYSTNSEITPPYDEDTIYYVEDASTIDDSFYAVHNFEQNDIIMFIDYDLDNNLINRFKVICSPETEGEGASYIIRRVDEDKYFGWYHVEQKWDELGGGGENGDGSLRLYFDLEGTGFTWHGIYTHVDFASDVLAGMPVYQKASDGLFYPAFADNVVDGTSVTTSSIETAPAIGIAVEDYGANGLNKKILIKGTIHYPETIGGYPAGYGDYNIGDLIYLSYLTDGDVINVAPDGKNLVYDEDEIVVDEDGNPIGTGQIQQILGRVVNDGVIYFDVNNVWLELERVEEEEEEE
jgi:hypothetical protein